PKNPRLHSLPQFSRKRLCKLFIDGNSDVGFRRTKVRRAISLAGTGMQGELTDDDNITIDIADTKIHNAGFIVEDAQVDDLRRKPFNVVPTLSVFIPNEQQQSLSYGSLDLAFYRYGCSAYTLNDWSHNQTKRAKRSDGWPTHDRGRPSFRNWRSAP